VILTQPLKGLTLMDPWASCFALAGTVRLPIVGKNIENRTWRTHHRGPLGIVAGKGWDPTGAQDPRVRALLGIRDDAAMRRFRRARPLGVVAVGDVVDCHPATGSCCRPWGEHNPDQTIFHFVFGEIVTLTLPVPVVGFRGIRPLEPAVGAAVAAPRVGAAA
jgi:hypothetical protein